MKLKRILSIILLFVLAMSSLFVSGCLSRGDRVINRIESQFETDGVFKYCKITKNLPQASKFEGTYALCGQEGILEKEVAIPAYYNGIPVTQMKLKGPDIGLWVPNVPTWSPTYYGAEEIFAPYSVEFDDVNWPASFRYVKKLFVPISKIPLHKIDYSLWVLFDDTENIFLGNGAFCSLIDQMESKQQHTLNIINDYSLSALLDKSADNPFNTDLIIQRANTTYCFNYEGSPNDDIFFINDFERGGKIENTPYEPLREGYKFAGWYKEPECINAWNFEKDTLPMPEYNENGELKYVETKLYAKWEKGNVIINPSKPVIKEELGTKVEYIVNNNTIAGANNYAKEKVTELEIPSEIDGVKITAIGDLAFRGYENLKKVVINEGVEKIGKEAFAWCKNLSEVQISESVIDIGEAAFRCCRSLHTVNIPSKIKEIKKETFSNTILSDEINIPQDVEIIGENAFSRTSIKRVSIPNNVTEIGKRAFYRCGHLEDITFGEKIYKIGKGAFIGCDELKEIELPTNLLEIGDFAFFACFELNNVKLPSRLEKIGARCFLNCSRLYNITVPLSVITIGSKAFLGTTIKCEALSKPIGWAEDWFVSSEVSWGYERSVE